MNTVDVDIAIIGSGFSGLGMAIRLQQEGIEDFTVLERGDDVGGTWHFNTYPGLAPATCWARTARTGSGSRARASGTPRWST
jgi:cation diffusion facilitator CzcD-associated flavoprotein CzcO